MRWPVLLALALGGCGAGGLATPSPNARPLRVMSINQCTDQLVLTLLPPERIASVSWLSRQPGGSLMAGRAARVPINHGLAEEVIAQRPDLIISGTATTTALRAMLRRLGYPLVEVGHANSFDDIRRITRQVAAATGTTARGEALIAAMDAKLAALSRDPRPPIEVVAWDRTGFSAGEGTLYNAILVAAGARNIAPSPDALSFRRPDMEALLAARPALLVQGSMDVRAASVGDQVMRHRLIRRYWGDRLLFVPQSYYVCGTPAIADAAISLRDQLRAAAARPMAPLPFTGGRS